jgi:hypothetical protein
MQSPEYLKSAQSNGRMSAPKAMIYMVGWAFDPSLKSIKRNIGHPLSFNNSRSNFADDLHNK